MDDAFYRTTLKQAEQVAAQLELSTGKDHAVTRINDAKFRIAPSRLVSAASAAVGALKRDPA